MTYRVPPQPRILEIEPYVPGESKASGNKIIRLAANENPFGCSPSIINSFIGFSSQLNRYPDGGSVQLRSAIAEFHKIDPDRIVCGTGSDEIITILCKAFSGAGDEVLYSEYGFLMYPIAALASGATPVKAPEKERKTDLQAILDSVTTKTKIVFIANPNNPTGYMLKATDIRRFRENLREDILLVIDSAYAEYVTDDNYSDGKDLVDVCDNVVMLRTFSKAYGLSALRVGWSYSSNYIADILNRVRGVFNINSIAQHCAILAIRDQNFIKTSIANNSSQRAWLSSKLSELGLEVYPSQGNFILVSFGENETGKDLASKCILFLKERGILIRGMKSYALPDCIRITIGKPDDMQIFVAAISDFSKSNLIFPN